VQPLLFAQSPDTPTGYRKVVLTPWRKVESCAKLVLGGDIDNCLSRKTNYLLH